MTPPAAEAARLGLVSGDPAVVDALGFQLVLEGYSVTVASTVDGLAERTAERRPPCIVLDLSNSAGEACGRLKDHARRGWRPAVVMMRSVASVPPEMISDLGPIEILDKPVMGDDLIEAIRRLTARASG